MRVVTRRWPTDPSGRPGDRQAKPLIRPEEVLWQIIERARTKAKTARVKFEAHVVTGHAVPSIIEFIERQGCDLLVIGYMGHSALYNRVIGSTTDRLVEFAPCQVLVVK